MMLLLGTLYADKRSNLHASDGLFLHIVRHIERGADGGHQAAGIGFARTGQIQGRAMIDGGADKGQAEGDVHTFAETASASLSRKGWNTVSAG